MFRRIALLTFILITLAFSMQCAQQGEVEEVETATGQSSSAVFVGETACLSCHPEAYLDWENSHHDWAMKPANDETVLGDFDLAEVQLDGVRYKFYKKEKEFLVEVDDLESDPEVYAIAYTFGVEPLQQYLVEFPGGRMQALRATWDTEQKKWFHQYSGQEIPEHDWMHWTRGGQNWNTMCADCHSTNLQSGYDWESDTYHSTWSSINVSCEACHGPGSQHLKWAEEAAEEDTDPYIHSVKGQTAQINTCGPCHARRTKLLDSITIGADFHEQFEIQTLSPEFYHPDGQIREEDYVLGSFLSSRMYLEGVMCTDCHNPHSNELILTGNALCMQCHEPEYDSEAHHFHPIETEGAECINCHMTGQYYMGNDFRRDHSFRIPRPDQSVVYGTPNACTGCHTDEGDEWAAKQVVEWYGPDRPIHFSDALLLSLRDSLTGEEAIDVQLLIGLDDFPYIAQATAIENYSFMQHGKDYEVLLSALNDPHPLLRKKAIEKHRGELPGQRGNVAYSYFDDSAILPRLAAVELSADMQLDQMTEDWKNAFQFALPEYVDFLFVNSDFATGRAQLGDYYMKRQSVDKAILHYKKALEMDDQIIPVYGNLATAYSLLGHPDTALLVLGKWIEIEPESSRAFYLRGLLHFELNNLSDAEFNFEYAILNDPGFYRGYYNLAILLYYQERYAEAKVIISKGLEQSPGEQDGKDLLNLLEQQL